MPLTIYGLRHRARQHLTTLSQRELASCLNSIAENTQQIFEDKLSWQVPVPSRMHLEWASSVLSAYQVMSDFCGDSNQGLAIIDDATHFAAAPRQPRRIARQFERAICNTPTMFMQSKKVRSAIVHTSRHYDTPWEWFLRETDGTRFVIKNPNCFWHLFFTNHEEPQLAKIFYRLDRGVTREIQKSRRIGLDPAGFKSQANGDSENAFTLVKLTD
ncbi:MAG: hypothetical protein CBC35_05395 [Planctomycetes bacterium TMED75]|nr:hypothetical protein [Planctomycetaceae bacterium]OUU93546.1 MAG: hypothetical protein CBC35_05395 [Planctomycetes bacterium TMED75]